MNFLWVWDLDSTCLDNTHREEHALADDWDTFHAYENLIKDPQTGWVKELDLWRDGQFRYGPYAYLTARDEAARQGTVDTLLGHGMLLPTTRLIMKDTPRKTFYGHEAGHHFKPRVLLGLAHANPDTEFFFLDDDEDILRVMESLDHPKIHTIDSIDDPVTWLNYYVSTYNLPSAW